MKTARVFLSHASPDKPLVNEVAAALSRRGILTWLDLQELRVGDDLSRALTRAVETHSVLALFLSENALDRPWMNDELAVALALEDQVLAAGAPRQPVLPVYLGDPLSLVKGHPLLRSRWLHPDGDRINRLGVPVSVEDDLATQARQIADRLTDVLYGLLELPPRAGDLALVLDQRGEGPRDSAIPSLPISIATSDAPALVFRSGLGLRTHYEVIQGQAWTELVSDFGRSLGRALGTRRPVPPKVRILGNSQLALAYALGARINRTTGAKLYAYDRNGQPLALDLGPFDTALAGGDAACARPGEGLLTATPETRGLRPASLALLLMHEERYLRQAMDAVRARDPSVPIAWIPHPRIETAAQIVTLARDVKAFVDHVHGSHVELATSLPFHALPLLGALLTPHVFDSVTFLEYVRGDHGRPGDYVPLAIP